MLRFNYCTGLMFELEAYFSACELEVFTQHATILLLDSLLYHLELFSQGGVPMTSWTYAPRILINLLIYLGTRFWQADA